VEVINVPVLKFGSFFNRTETISYPRSVSKHDIRMDLMANTIYKPPSDSNIMPSIVIFKPRVLDLWPSYSHSLIITDVTNIFSSQ